MYRLNHILSHLTSLVHSESSVKESKCASASSSTALSKEVTSLDIFEFMNAILNGGRGGGVNEIILRDQVKLRKVFDKINLDGSGDLSLSEFGKAARLCSMVISESEINEIFNKIATSGRNKISFDEFREAIESLSDSFKISYDAFEKLDKDKKLVIALWDKHMNGNKKAADLFTRKLRKHPSLRTLVNVDLDRQVNMVYGMISNAIRALTDVDRLTSRLEKEGRRHYYTFKLGDKHYEAVKQSLFQTLPMIMGEDYNFYTQMQYEKYVKVIIDAMLKGYNDR